MGQNIVIADTKTVGCTLLVDMDRSFGGQDGEVFTREDLPEMDGILPEWRRYPDDYDPEQLEPEDDPIVVGKGEKGETNPLDLDVAQMLARRIFATDPQATRVHIMSNVISITRQDEWSDPDRESVLQLIQESLIFYLEGIDRSLV